MQAIIIGAGRGRRLMPTLPTRRSASPRLAAGGLSIGRCTAFRPSGLERVAFIGGYQIDKVRRAYRVHFRHNDNWRTTTILASLFYAEDLMDEGFLCC